MKHLFTLKSLLLTLVMLCGLNAWGATTLFHETFGDNSSSARDWKDSYSVKSGIGAVYSSVGYTITNAKQSKNTVGAVKSGLTQTTSNKDASIVIGPLNAAACSEMVLTYQWKVGSIKGTYTTSASYATSADGEYVALEGEGSPTAATSFCDRTYSLPVEAQVSTLYLKIVWNTSNSQAVIDEVDLSGVYSESGFVAKPEITEVSTPDLGSSYLTTSTAKATISCKTDGASIKYAITEGTAEPTAWSDYRQEAGVAITPAGPGTKTLWAKADKEGKSAVASKEFTFITEPEGTYFVRVTNASQLVAGAKYVITNASATQIINGYVSGETYFSTTDVTANGDYIPAADNGAIMFTLGGNGDVKDSWTLYDNTTNKYVGGSTTTSFNLADDASASGFLNWTINFIDANGKAEIYNSTTSTVRGFVYRTLSSGNSVRNYAKSNYTTSGYEYVTLWQVVEKPVATTVGLKEVLAGEVGKKYQINCALYCHYSDGDAVYASTIGGGSTATAPTAAQAKEYWSDKVENFRQNDWVAIADLDETYVGKEIEAGSVATYVENNGFPVIKFDSMNAKEGTKVETNTYRVANFNIGSTSPVVNKLWLVAPQPAEYCYVKGYVSSLEKDVVEADGIGVATIKSGESGEVVTAKVMYDVANFSITATGWYRFDGIVLEVGSERELQLYASKVNVGTATGVEGVEASSVKVYGAEGVINVVSEEVAPIAVYSANGAIVSSVEASSASIAVAPGFYIVKAGNSVSKVTVK